MSLSEQDVRAIIRDEFRKMAGIESQNDIEWFNAKEAARRLGYESVRSLYTLKDNGVLRLGKEYQDRRTPGSTKGDYYFNLKACDKRLNTSPEKRV